MRSALARCFGLAGITALLAASGCLAWFADDRPWLVNSTHEMLEVESTHADGHKLKIMLYPGSRVPLGAAEEPVCEIALKRPHEPQVVVPESEIRSCLQDRERDCQGWNVSDAGVATIGSHERAAQEPAAEPAPAAPADDGLAVPAAPDDLGGYEPRD